MYIYHIYKYIIYIHIWYNHSNTAICKYIQLNYLYTLYILKIGLQNGEPYLRERKHKWKIHLTERHIWKGNYGWAVFTLRWALCSLLPSSLDDVYSHLTQGAVMLTEDEWFTKVSSLQMEIGFKCTPVCLHSLCSFRSDVMGYITEGTKRVDVFPPPPPSKGGFKITTDGLA